MTSTDFYPRPPRGGRPLALPLAYSPCKFLSTPSARRATSLHDAYRVVLPNFYPRPPRGGRRDLHCFIADFGVFLSTPSARRATYPQKYQHQNNPISIHALREEGDGSGAMRGGIRLYFYPRPPRGGRHSLPIRLCQTMQYFYPRPPRGGRPKTTQGRGHRLRFLSTPSARRATQKQTTSR